MKKIIILMLILLMLLVGCQEQQYHANGVPIYFLEPDGYIIAEIDTTSFLDRKYGYISNQDYQSYLDGKDDGILVIKHPYEDGKEVSMPYREIKSISIGEYKDLR